MRKIAAAALLAAMTISLLPASAAEFIPSAALAPGIYPNHEAPLEGFTPAAALAPAYLPNGGLSKGYDSGSCGTHVVYYFDKNTKVLSFTIFPNVIGGGAMWDYGPPGDTKGEHPAPPWRERDYADDIKEITFGEGVRSIGANAFAGLKNVDIVNISASIGFIGPNAFGGMALEDLNFLGITPPVLDASAFGPPESEPAKAPTLRYPERAKAAYEGFIDNASNNWGDLTVYTREPFKDIAFVSLEEMKNDTPMIYDVEYTNGTISYSVYVQSANSAYYANAVVRVKYNEKLSEDITLGVSGKGRGSFPAQPGEANFGASLLNWPRTHSNRHFIIVKEGMITTK